MLIVVVALPKFHLLFQILQLATIPQSALYVTRKQFYSCLKLIAAHQASVPLRPDVIPTSVALPLPRFSWRDSPTLPSAEATNGIEEKFPNASDPQWNEVHSPNLIQLSNNPESLVDTTNSDLHSTDSEIEHNDIQRGEHKRHNRDGSPEAWSTASDSPTPTNSVAERPWAKGNLWHGLLCEEQRQLLATEEESSDRHSSDDDVDLESVFQITAEQREYYTKQFRTVQPDPNGLLSGPVARMFFEKSRIPVEELRHIWQLCDVTRDGALSLEEFTAAMHLVVLRRNNIPLPQNLPPCLLPGGSAAPGDATVQAINQPSAPKNPPEADLLHLNDDDDEEDGEDDEEYDGDGTVGNSLVTVVGGSSPILTTSSTGGRSISNSPVPAAQVTPPLPPKPVKVAEKDWNSAPAPPQPTNREWNVNNREWTKFNESPTSNVSSPGLKPVNFDMQRTAQAVVSDPQILHPVALRVTPVGGSDVVDEGETMRRSLVYDNRDSHDRESSPKQSEKPRDSLQSDLRPIQRPQPKKLPAKTVGAIPPPPQREASLSFEQSEQPANGTSTKKDPPPLPPPR